MLDNFTTEMALQFILAILLAVFALAYYYLNKRYNYWKARNVPHLKPRPIVGNFSEYILLKGYIGEVEQKICLKFPNEPYIGSYYGTEPALIVQNPELIKHIMTKDYYYFSSREVSKYTHKEVFTQNMFFTYGDRWKVIRQNFTPLFSSAKMKNMFHLIVKCAHVLENLLDEELQVSDVIEIRALMARYTMDCIGSCVFGVETDAMGKDVKSNPFRTMGDLLFEISNIRGFSLIARSIWPAIFYGLGRKTFPEDLDRFFKKLMLNVFADRQYKPSARNDFIDLVLSLKTNKYISGDSLINMKTNEGKRVHLKVDDDLLVAQCLSFFAAGFETSATTLSFTMYELAKNQESQKKAFEEVDEYLRRHGGRLGYECVTELPYLEACVDEALRLYPVLGILTREVVEDYTLPTGLVLEKGVRVHLPVYHLHHYPGNFPDPEKYCPERFLPENKRNIKPYVYMPFGEGPRICIGMRFAKMQILTGLISVLKKYRLELGPGMPRTVGFEPRGLVTQPSRGIDLRLVARSGWEKRVFAE